MKRVDDRMKNLKCGLVSVSFREHTPEEIVIASKKSGLTCVEWGSDIHAPCDNSEKINRIVELQKKYKIICSSYGTYFRLGEDDINNLQRYIDTAKLLGTRILRLWCGDRAAEEYSENEKQNLFAECIKAAAVAQENDVIICLECHNRTYTETIEGSLELMKAVNSPNFRMYWQPNHWKTEEENLSYAQLIAPYCERVHVFNWTENKQRKLKLGKDIWKKYIKILENTDTYLLEFMPDNKIESLNEEADALLDIVSKA